jgi:Cof subfamily protein (haloacid dehalogenase superfamily)
VTGQERSEVVRPPIAAVLTDVDGTLVTKEKVLTPRAIKAVQTLQERGVLFAITSGRPPRGMRMLVEPLGMDIPMAAFNGGVIVMPDMTIVDERIIPPKVTPAIMEMVRSFGLYVWIYESTEWYITDLNAPRAARESRTVQFEPTLVPSYDAHLDRVIKLVGVSEDHARVAECEAAVQQRFGAAVSASRSQPHYLDVTHPMANKGVVVHRLSSYFKIPRDQVVTIGDQLNDVLMFKQSGLSIAMGNANPEVQRQATFVTASHEDEGFARAIEEIVLPLCAGVPAHRRAA